MLIERKQTAPAGSTFARYAFLKALGEVHALRVDGKYVGKATLIGAIPGPDRRTINLTWEVEEISTEAAFMMDELDDYDAGDMYNPARAVKTVQQAGFVT